MSYSCIETYNMSQIIIYNKQLLYWFYIFKSKLRNLFHIQTLYLCILLSQYLSVCRHDHFACFSCLSFNWTSFETVSELLFFWYNFLIWFLKIWARVYFSQLSFLLRTANTPKNENQIPSSDRQRTPQPEVTKPKQQQSAACTPVKKAHHWIETLLKVPLTSSSVNKMTHNQLRRTSRNCLPGSFCFE